MSMLYTAMRALITQLSARDQCYLTRWPFPRYSTEEVVEDDEDGDNNTRDSLKLYRLPMHLDHDDLY